MLLEDGKENVVFQRPSKQICPSEDSIELGSETAKRTPSRALKRKRVEESETQAKFLNIAKQQADALKVSYSEHSVKLYLCIILSFGDSFSIDAGRMQCSKS